MGWNRFRKSPRENRTKMIKEKKRKKNNNDDDDDDDDDDDEEREACVDYKIIYSTK